MTLKLNLETLTSSPKIYIQTLLKIKADGQLKPFKFNEVQNKVYSIIRKEQLANKPVRVILLKARQTGMSTLSEALIFFNTVTRPYTSSLIIAHDKESTQNIFRMSKLFYDKLPDIKELKPMRKTSNRNELYFDNPSDSQKGRKPGLNSYIRVDTAGNPDAGRSFSLQNLHISELSSWDDGEGILSGLFPTVKPKPNTMIIIESTAKGIGNYFYEMWQNAVNGLNEYIPIFIAWYELESYRLTPPKDFKLYDYEHEIFGNEVKLAETFNLDNSQLWWRRYTIRNECNNDLQYFKQEYPATATEAFLVTGRKIFDGEMIGECMESIKRNNILPKRGELIEQVDVQPEGNRTLADMART